MLSRFAASAMQQQDGCFVPSVTLQQGIRDVGGGAVPWICTRYTSRRRIFFASCCPQKMRHATVFIKRPVRRWVGSHIHPMSHLSPAGARGYFLLGGQPAICVNRLFPYEGGTLLSGRSRSGLARGMVIPGRRVPGRICQAAGSLLTFSRANRGGNCENRMMTSRRTFIFCFPTVSSSLHNHRIILQGVKNYYVMSFISQECAGGLFIGDTSVRSWVIPPVTGCYGPY